MSCTRGDAHPRRCALAETITPVISALLSLQVAAVARDTPAVDKVAEILMNKAKVEYLQNRGLPKMGDDTTVMVIDLNPSKVAFESRAATCCALL